MNDAVQQFTLLLVDDNPINLTLLAKIIELDLPQVQVLTANNGLDGLRLAEQERIDGAFIDVQMPGMSGLEVCRRLKADPRTAAMPLVLITAHLASPEMRAEGLEVGAYDFISQPISNVEMLARLKVMLRLCEGERARQTDAAGLLSGVESPAQLRWLSGLFLSADGASAEPEPKLLQQLAAELSVGEEMDELLLAELWAGRFPLPWRRTLLKLSLLEQFPVALAAKLSELADIEALFDYLQRHDLLLETAGGNGGVLRFKAEVHKLLQGRREKQLDEQETLQVFRLAADWYQQKDHPVEAFECLLQAGLFSAIGQLLSHFGLQLLADQYQSRLLKLLAQVPEEEAVGCGWLALYTGVSYMRNQPLDVGTWLELARNHFVATSDQRGELLTVSQQIVQYLVADGQVELGQAKLPRLRQLAEAQLELLTPFNRIKVQFALGLGELFYAGALKRCEGILSQAMSEALRGNFFELQLELALLQVLLGIYQGRYLAARTAMEQAWTTARNLSADCYPVLILRVVACELLCSCGELDGFAQQRHQLRQIWGREEFQKSAFSPIVYFFSAMAEIAKARLSVAEEMLDLALVESPAALRPHLRSWLLQLRGFMHALAGHREAGLADCGKGLELRRQAATGLHQLPNRLLAGASAVLLQEQELALEQLQAGLTISLDLEEGRFRGGFHAWLAALYLDRDDQVSALEQLGHMFELLRKQRIDFFFALTPDLLRKLLPLAMTNLAWTAQVQRLTERWLDSDISADGRLLPYAELQMLGGFSYRLEGQCFDLNEVGQSSRQLLALLAVTPNHSMSSELLMGTLWPESPPNKARNSFDSALSRLRKTLEGSCGKQIRQDYLLLDKGMLLLRHLRIDCTAFAQAIGAARRHLQRQNFWQAELAFWLAGRLWRGPFLPGFELDAELPYQREEYILLRLEQLSGLSRLLVRRGEFEEAVRLLQTALQIEPANDVLVRNLLDIYQLRGEKHAVHLLLDSYRKALQEEDYDVDEIDELITALGPQRLEV